MVDLHPLLPPDAADAAQKIVLAEPEAVLLGLAGRPTVETIPSINQRKRGIVMYAPSVLAAPRGPHLTRPGFMAAMETIRRLDLGGMEVAFGNGAASGSRLVELTMVSADGRLIRRGISRSAAGGCGRFRPPRCSGAADPRPS